MAGREHHSASPAFGDVAEAPPTITLKRKSGGKGAKTVPIEQSGHKIATSKTGNRHAKIFKNLLQAAEGSSARAKSKQTSMGERQVADMEFIRNQVISDYRALRGRPQNNGRSLSLATDPTRLFSAATSATADKIRRDAGKVQKKRAK